MRRYIFLIVLNVFFCGDLQASVDFTITEDILLGDEFSSKSWGPGDFSLMDVFGEAVQFSFSDLTGSGTGLKDDYPVQDYGQILPSHGNGDFSIFEGYSLWVSNTGQTDVTVSLFINTGFTGPSGVPSSDWTNDTFWQSSWESIAPGQWIIMRLDFDNARPYNIADNKEPHTQGGTGQWTAINAYDRTEVSAIGFEVLGSGEATILVGPSTIPEPSSLLLFGLGSMIFSRMRRYG